jgi:hypothetical protein
MSEFPVAVRHPAGVDRDLVTTSPVVLPIAGKGKIGRRKQQPWWACSASINSKHTWILGNSRCENHTRFPLSLDHLAERLCSYGRTSDSGLSLVCINLNVRFLDEVGFDIRLRLGGRNPNDSAIM